MRKQGGYTRTSKHSQRVVHGALWAVLCERMRSGDCSIDALALKVARLPTGRAHLNTLSDTLRAARTVRGR
eukprot:13642528-Alexandrium_andersonii.AAC.1